MENCRESCGYCSPGTQTGGFFNKCSYKGVQYSQGDMWDDGCSYECECTDASTGRYQCYNKCPSYYNIPDECTLVQIPGQCCLEPHCDFQHNYTTKDVSASCNFNLQDYKEGEVWSVGCQFECICVDAAHDLYTCQSKCPHYDVLPGNCKLMTPPGKQKGEDTGEARFIPKIHITSLQNIRLTHFSLLTSFSSSSYPSTHLHHQH